MYDARKTRLESSPFLQKMGIIPRRAGYAEEERKRFILAVTVGVEVNRFDMMWKRKKQGTSVVSGFGDGARGSTEPGNQAERLQEAAAEKLRYEGAHQNTDTIPDVENRFAGAEDKVGFTLPVAFQPCNRPFVIPRSYCVTGSIATERQIVVEGEFCSGTLSAPLITVAPKGQVKGTIAGGNIQIAGFVEATVTSDRGVEVVSQGRLCGEVTTPAIKAAPGALLDGVQLHVVSTANTSKAA